MTVSPKRVAAIAKMSSPSDKDEPRSRLGVFGYDRRFIKNYSQIAAPLNQLLNQDVPFKWTTVEQTAFDKLKTVLSNPPALRLYSPFLNNRVCTDASYQGLGVALYQQDSETRRFHPVAFASRKLKSSEEKLPVYYLECIGSVFAFVQFRCYLQNRNVETEVLTDHQSLQALLKTPKPEGPIAKPIMYLAQFKFNIKYRTGKSNVDADGLSRAPVESPEKIVDELVEDVFPDRIELNNAVTAVTTRAQLAKEQADEKIAQQMDVENRERSDSPEETLFSNDPEILQKLQRDDEVLSKIMDNLTSPAPNKRYSKYKIRDGLLRVRLGNEWRLVVPQNLRASVLQEFHDNRGHRATKHLLRNVLEHFWWPSVAKDCSLYYESCRYCMTHKTNPQEKFGLLSPTLAKQPFAAIA